MLNFLCLLLKHQQQPNSDMHWTFDTDTQEFFITPKIKITYSFVYRRRNRKVKSRSIKIVCIKIEKIKKIDHSIWVDGIKLFYTVFERCFVNSCFDLLTVNGVKQLLYTESRIRKDLKSKNFITQ